jgi:hypothetical protein
MLEIEYPEAVTSNCECCGNKNTRLTRFVTQDGDAVAVYYAVFSSGHPENGVIGVVSIGEWWEGTGPESRDAFAFRLWEGPENYNVSITDAQESEWGDVDLIGRKLSREEALAHHLLSDVFHITDHMTSEDPAIREFFGLEKVN